MSLPNTHTPPAANGRCHAWNHFTPWATAWQPLPPSGHTQTHRGSLLLYSTHCQNGDRFNNYRYNERRTFWQAPQFVVGSTNYSRVNNNNNNAPVHTARPQSNLVIVLQLAVQAPVNEKKPRLANTVVKSEQRPLTDMATCTPRFSWFIH